MYNCIHQNNLIDTDIMKHWRPYGIFIFNFEKIPYLFWVFHISLLNLGEVLVSVFTGTDQSLDK